MKMDYLKNKLFDLNKSIMAVIKECEYEKSGTLEIDFDVCDSDECMMYHMFTNILTHLDYVSLLLDYIQKPIKEEGTITIDCKGKYKLNKTTLKKYDFVEILRQEEGEQAYWDLTYVEGQYELEGKQARLRKWKPRRRESRIKA